MAEKKDNTLSEKSISSEKTKENSSSHKDTSFPFVRKASGLLAAVYAVTNFISDTEPLCRRMREEGIFLLDAAADAAASGCSDLAARERVCISAEKMRALLSAARYGRLISEMNARVLIEEYGLLCGEVRGEYERFRTDARSLLSEFALPHTERGGGAPHPILSAAAPSPELSPREDIKDKTYKGQNKDKKVSFTPEEKKAGRGRAHMHPKSPSKRAEEKEARKEAIIALIRRKGVVGIKDISSVISHCSEKTIQRDLLSLVAQNVLLKEGNRRWSVYRLRRG